MSYLVEAATCERGGRTILDAIDLEVRPGELLALVGPNGAGKSTLLGALAGDLRLASGRISLTGRPLAEWTARELARQRAVLLQANRVSFGFTVAQVVELGRSPWAGRPEAGGDETAIEAALVATDTVHLTHRAYASLSGGEQARVSLARVLAQATPVVLLDEPTAALDLRHTTDVLAQARRLAHEGRTVVVVLHDLSEAGAWADRIAVLDAGRLAAVGAPGDVLTADLVSQVYGIAVDIITSTPDGPPIVVPRRSATPTNERTQP